MNGANQHKIDELFGLDPKSSDQQLPYGLSRETAKEILELLSYEATISSAECAQHMGQGDQNAASDCSKPSSRMNWIIDPVCGSLTAPLTTTQPAVTGFTIGSGQPWIDDVTVGGSNNGCGKWDEVPSILASMKVRVYCSSTRSPRTSMHCSSPNNEGLDGFLTDGFISAMIY